MGEQLPVTNYISSDEYQKKSIYSQYYIERVSKFGEVAAVTYQKTGNYHHFHIIFSEHNFDIYDQICNIELEMCDKYSEAHFYFTSQVLNNKDDKIDFSNQSGNTIYRQELKTYAE